MEKHCSYDTYSVAPKQSLVPVTRNNTTSTPPAITPFLFIFEHGIMIARVFDVYFPSCYIRYFCLEAQIMKAERALKSKSLLRNFVRPELEHLSSDDNGYGGWPTKLYNSVVTIAFSTIIIIE